MSMSTSTSHPPPLVSQGYYDDLLASAAELSDLHDVSSSAAQRTECVREALEELLPGIGSTPGNGTGNGYASGGGGGGSHSLTPVFGDERLELPRVERAAAVVVFHLVLADPWQFIDFSAAMPLLIRRPVNLDREKHTLQCDSVFFGSQGLRTFFFRSI